MSQIIFPESFLQERQKYGAAAYKDACKDTEKALLFLFFRKGTAIFLFLGKIGLPERKCKKESEGAVLC